MAGRGRKFVFHGMFSSKARALARERKLKGAFVRKVKGRKRWYVATRRKR